ncbi:UDP-N-acetylmuramoyl-tripeptide--D-alanyl-D-alanine ligase [Gordonia pseudamarae]|jgi:hypothetical protein|uniref:UDP-N-acetylmuramoyl-tripeptide--D-alanyl-D-alanine ligase n=1 Tax=Gordonia pseudamarae TaxID=2831662 RepID=A0ABX6IK51_9ACTN|nr:MULTISPECIES: UDP-N-acetylmuramoyl-tripeptide--D-alanyl-D-alanine ligase [Gordonia]MBD0022647.1 UDP-N-acetylmuramoyl-tripeptide--D-alanyl-D-alanine ligase [Gordonia sp. (in: high G+C Gram-positive bacteria)]QHN26799.1 UDP-N-acetylmuramoyl-tripeptide--D-alanyl-D-alanine ligase [Gordonia pseudamarae]QHN35690.1 UDP-N-acetylmuramoyl-tripeptide--D-alanyl-D-alanine ligase [Gordonia pseudamarae]
MSTVTILSVDAPAGVAEIRELLRTAAQLRAGAVPVDGPVRIWALIGELELPADTSAPDGRSENERVVEHDLVGRLVVRLAIDKTLCVGGSRSVRALYQGAIMEGSWGDEVRIVPDAAQALEMTADEDDESWRPRAGDIVVVAGPAELVDVVRQWPTVLGYELDWAAGGASGPGDE